jgi:pimeloyl-ACP methyl ester carboxylesterase
VGLAVAVALRAGLAAGAATDAGHPRYLIYLHGRIVQEQQSVRPRHPQYGFYELEKILDTLRGRGFVVTGEMRPKAASVSDSADRVVGQIRRLLESGVPPDRITVVGASMGASIAFLASTRLQNPDVRFCVLGACLSANVRALLADEGRGPSGHLLAIREASDDSSGPCPPWKSDPDAQSPLRAREIVLHTGLSHGFIYRPLPEWVDPVADWAAAR